MPLYAFLDNFNIPPNKTSGYILVSGVPFQPKLGIFNWANKYITASSDYIASGYSHFIMSITVSGAYHNANTKMVGGQTVTNGGTTSHCGSYLYDYETVSFQDAGDLDKWTMTPSGYHLLPDRASFPVATKITCLSLGGSDITRSYIGNYVGLSTTGYINVTSPGFQPDLMIDLTMYYAGMNGSSNTDNCSMGWATSSGEQGGIAWIDGSNPSNSCGKGFNDAIANKITTSKTTTSTTTPGFEAVFAVAGLLAVTFVALRRRH